MQAHPRLRSAKARLEEAWAGLQATAAELHGSWRVEGRGARMKLSDEQKRAMADSPLDPDYGQRLSAAVVWSGSLWMSPQTEAA